MKVLILNTVCCWRKANDPFVFLGKELADRGIDVHHLVGGGELCTFDGTLPDWSEQKCASIQERVTNNIQSNAIPVQNLRSFETPEMRERIDAWWQKQQDLPPGERTYRGFRIRNLIRGSLARHLFRPLHPDPEMPGGEESGSPEERELAQRLARAAALGIEMAEAALKEIKPDVVLLFNGYFYMEWIFSEMARRLGIRAVAHEIACFANRMYFDATGMIGNRHMMSSSMLRHRMDAQELTRDERLNLKAFLQDIYDGRVNNIAQAQTEDPAALRERLGLPADKKIILLIGQVSYDTVVIYDSGTFPTLLDFLRAGIEAASQIPDCHLVIRLHPHEVNVNNNWTLRQLETWNLPSNVTIIHSRQANTYQIMELADCGLAMTSQAGLEMTAFGKPVVVTGNAFYAHKGFTHDVSRPEDLRPALEKALASGGLTPQQTHNLETYLEYHIFHYLIPFDTDNDRFTPDAIDRIIKVMDPIGNKQYAQRPATPLAPPVNIAANPLFLEGIEGWKAAGGAIERVSGNGFVEEGKYALKCSSGRGAWNGVLYGCEKTNTCDAKTLPCEAITQHTVSVTIKGISDYQDVIMQLHVIGDAKENFGTAKVALNDSWQKISMNFATKPETKFLGVQIVKYNNDRPAVFLVGELQVLPASKRRVASGAPSVIVKDPKDFPRLLILDEVPFGNHTGYGVTVTNLFRGWPKEQMAEIYRMIDYEPDVSVCLHHLPLYDSSRDKIGKTWPKGLRQFEYAMKLRMGQFDVNEHAVNIDRALRWIKPFKPEVIFTSPVTYATARFALELSRKLGIPYVCHIMDDWLAHWEQGIRPANPARNEPSLQLKRNKLTRQLWAGAAKRQVISGLMAESYKQRYGYEFEVVHNAIDLTRWDLGPKDYSHRSTPFRILYTGAIWWNIQMPTLKHFADAVAELGAAGHPIKLEIYTHPSFEKQYSTQLANLPYVEFCGLAPYDEMPRLMHEADALLVPVTFDEKMFVYSRCSMPTKIPECMVSGTPIILHGPAGAAPVDYGLRENWGYVITDPDKENLKQKLITLMNDPELRERISVPAQELARKAHDLAGVREKFWNQIKEAARR